jgi:hypothetical protein
MACLGRHGRWGNTLMGYFFLKAFARVHQMASEVPRWIGEDLFGRQDDAITQVHPIILYDMVSDICQESHYPAVTFSLAASRARTVRETGGRTLFVLRDPLLAHPEYPLPGPSLDLEGPYFLHTRHLSPHRDYLRRLVQPVPALRERLESAWRDLSSRGDAVIGVHVRRSDFDGAFSRQGFEFVAPARWYLAWLEQLWVRYDHPVLFLASDSLEEVLPAFNRYNPVTTRDLGVRLPPELLDLDLPLAHVEPDASFFPDWFMLTRCHAVATSNSTFSFTACMMNETASLFVRPDLRLRTLVPFDPWDSEPLLFLPPARNLPLDALRRLFLAQRGMGLRATMPGLRQALRWYVSVLKLRAMACRHYFGPRGLSRELRRPQFYLAARRRYDERSAGRSDPAMREINRPQGRGTNAACG